MTYWRKNIDKSKIQPKRYKGKITGIYPDLQSRMQIEVTFDLNGKPTLVKKLIQQLNFVPKVDDEVLVEFYPQKNGVIINIRKI
jgi:hypothetical protein